MLKIIISVSEQIARVFNGEKEIKAYTISTARNGTGSESGSYKTPLGRLRVHKKIGDEMPMGTIFKSRVATEDVCTQASDEDLVLTRILWLEGIEDSNSNTLERFIYLHGTNQEHLLGTPASHGCIRFSNRDILELYDLVSEGTEVVVLV